LPTRLFFFPATLFLLTLSFSLNPSPFRFLPLFPSRSFVLGRAVDTVEERRKLIFHDVCLASNPLLAATISICLQNLDS
jgi:hypothetical protein